mmetsp:Transcript_27647/g.38853  ORF Transcript_27647/g.38853 Transcript_27647/m.38853 type:complete len:230 (-) Transcript_27647:68-757(-)
MVPTHACAAPLTSSSDSPSSKPSSKPSRLWASASDELCASADSEDPCSRLLPIAPVAAEACPFEEFAWEMALSEEADSVSDISTAALALEVPEIRLPLLSEICTVSVASPVPSPGSCSSDSSPFMSSAETAAEESVSVSAEASCVSEPVSSVVSSPVESSFSVDGVLSSDPSCVDSWEDSSFPSPSSSSASSVDSSLSFGGLVSEPAEGSERIRDAGSSTFLFLLLCFF